jgi:murein DD-endopeptidase MepM/ murein hydrolase activator NlpD
VKILIAFVVVAFALVRPLPVHAADAPFDSAAVVAKARMLNDAVKLSDAATLWAEFDDKMQAAMGGDVAKFEQVLKSITAQVGTMRECVSEEVKQQGSLWIYRGMCRFEKANQLLVTQYAFTPFGKVAGFSVRPEAKLYDSKFLDYATKTTLQLPFFGLWKVAWGGRTLEQNYHAATRDQRFAYDLIAVKDSSDRGGSGRLNTDYYAFGQTIVAPAAGKIVEAVDGLPDNVPGESDPKHPAGNHVIIDFGNNEFGLLAHFQRGSVRVKEGQTVAPGDTLARCGNSGNTSQPHLHFHVQNGPTLFQADGLPAPFSDYVANGQPVAKGEPLRGERIERKP